MSATAQFVVAAEGMDDYAAGAIGNVFPWFQTNSAAAGQIVADAGAFGTNALSFTAGAVNQSGMELQFPSTMQVLRNQSAAGGTGAFGVSCWIEIGTPVVSNDTDILLAIGPSSAESEALPILGLTNSSGSGLSLVLPSTTANLTTSPHLLSVSPNTYVWIGVYFSYKPTGVLTATMCLAGSGIFQDVSVTFSTDIFSAGQLINRLKFYQAVTGPWSVDDVCVQAVSSADAIWPAPSSLAPELIPQWTPRQISFATATGNGSVDQMTPSGSEPNYQSATDQTGANYVTATAINQVDVYTFSTAASDIKAVIYRGASTKYNNLSAVQNVSGTTSVMGVTEAGPNEFIGISENDGTNAWTDASIAAAGFGQTSHY
jgi:hypothetical protein